jgi:hypothetical protein
VDDAGLLLLHLPPGEAADAHHHHHHYHHHHQQQQHFQMTQMQTEPPALLLQPQPLGLDEAPPAAAVAGLPGSFGPPCSNQVDQQEAVRPQRKRRLPPITLLQQPPAECPTTALTLPPSQQQQQLEFSLQGSQRVPSTGWFSDAMEPSVHAGAVAAGMPVAHLDQVDPQQWQQQPQYSHGQRQVGWWSTASHATDEADVLHGLQNASDLSKRRRSSGRRSISGSAAASMF